MKENWTKGNERIVRRKHEKYLKLIETDNGWQLKVTRNGVVYDPLKLANGLPVSQYGTNYSQHTYSDCK